MADVFSASERSRIMSRVRSAGNLRTELELRAVFREQHYVGWRRGVRLPGQPDFVFSKKRLAIFVDGCFWHSCPAHGQTPKSNVAFWSRKLRRNVERDAAVRRTLRRNGWEVVRVWEHELTPRNRARLLRRLSHIFDEVISHG